MLTIVPTPIGNLGDITLRAIEAIKEADLLLAEDTRNTGKLLKHLDISVKMRSYHAHNEHGITEEILALLASGMKVALVSDAGTPGISDPGFMLVRACVEADIPITCLPGPTAFVPALVMSGLPCDRFVFEGFLPHKKGRQTRLTQLSEETRTMVFYESPHRIAKSLRQMAEFFGEDRPCTVSRELSKLYEETVRGSLLEVASHFENKPAKGEIVVCVGGA